MDEPRATLALRDYRRRGAELYAAVRSLPPEAGWTRWREGRNELFRTHSQSPLTRDARATFPGLAVFGYDPDLRVAARIDAAGGSPLALSHSGAGTTRARPFAIAGSRSADDPWR